MESGRGAGRDEFAEREREREGERECVCVYVRENSAAKCRRDPPLCVDTPSHTPRRTLGANHMVSYI